MSHKIPKYQSPTSYNTFGITETHAFDGLATSQELIVSAFQTPISAGGTGEGRVLIQAVSDEDVGVAYGSILFSGNGSGINSITNLSGNNDIRIGTGGGYSNYTFNSTAVVAAVDLFITCTGGPLRMNGSRIDQNISGTTRVQITSTSPYAYKTAGGVWGTLSDERLKQNIRPISDALGKLNSLNPCHFEFKNAGENANPEGTRTGFIAQEFEQVLPGHTFEIEPAIEADKMLLGEGVKAKGIEADLVPYLVKAIQELSAKVSTLETKLSALQG